VAHKFSTLAAVVVGLVFQRLVVLHLLVVVMVLMVLVRLDLQTLVEAVEVLAIFLMCHHKLWAAQADQA
jgi:hypothetical protein